MLTPSTAHLWGNCALSAHFVRTGGDVDTGRDTDAGDSEARREGSAAHWVADGVLRGDAHSCGDFEGETAPNGWVVTPDMVRHVQGYVDFVRSLGSVVRSEGMT